MKHHSFILLFILISALFADIYAQNSNKSILQGDSVVWVEINGTDTMLVVYLHDVYIFPTIQFKNRKQEQFYWKTVRDVKKTLPYAKLISKEINKTNRILAELPNNKERKRYLSQYEKEVFKKYEPELKNMTINQGKMLLKLINRECDQTSYDLIKNYRGIITATFWQGVARLFGTNLKSEYDATDKDKIIERVIILVENGQL